jgi:uncharacterized membrane protein YidH (DUF202 family)
MNVPSSGLSDTFGALMALAGVSCAAFGAYRYVVGARALRAANVVPLSDTAAVVGAAFVAVIGLFVAFALPALR